MATMSRLLAVRTAWTISTSDRASMSPLVQSTLCSEWWKGEGRETSGRGREERAGLTQLHPLAKSHHSVENWSASATLSYNSRCPCSPQRARQRSGDGVHTAPLRRLAAGERYRAAATATATAMRGQTSLTSRSRRSAKLSTSLCVAIGLPCRFAPRRAEPGRQWAAQQGRRDASVCTVIWEPPS